MNIKELITSKEQSIEKLTSLISANEDGETFIGNGKEIVDHKVLGLKHSFADQVYIRQMEMEQGRLVVGAIHKHLHVWFLLTGNLTISTKDGVEDYEAPCYVISKPGTQRVIYANEDSIFVNIHKNPTNNKNIKELEKEIVALNKQDYEKYIRKQKP